MKSIYSLKGRNLFKEVYQKGRKIQGTGVRLYALTYKRSNYAKPDSGHISDKQLKKIKIAISLTKSYGKAHIRNNAKRRIRAICTESFNELREGFCIIIRVESDFRNLAFSEQKRTIRSLFIQAGLLNGDAN